MTETGNRDAFLSRLAVRGVSGPHASGRFPPPPSPLPRAIPAGGVPTDLAKAFAESARGVKAEIHFLGRGTAVSAFVGALVKRHQIADAVVSADPECPPIASVLTALGVTVREATPEAAATAQLGVSAAAAAIATTGSVIHDAGRAGGRSSSLLPPMHLCLVPVECIVATPSDVFRSLGTGPMPSQLTVITGPSRTGDIEQIITLGAHGPVTLHLAVVD